MGTNLKGAFRAYDNLVKSKLSMSPGKTVSMEPSALRSFIEELEEKPEFYNLVLETNGKFSGTEEIKNEASWKNAVKNYLRRSEYYLKSLEKDIFPVDEAFKKFGEAFEKKDFQIYYLVPLELVSFCEERMDFGSFQIEKFTKYELEHTFQNQANEIFYPWAVADVKKLQDYWFLSVKEKKKIPRLGLIEINFNELDYVNLEFTKYPKAVESVIQQLALFDWQIDLWRDPSTSGKNTQEQDQETGWYGFEIPFILATDDNLIASPRRVPDLSKLLTEPRINHRTETEYEIRSVLIDLDQDETDSFIAFTQHTGSLLSCLKDRESDWNFFTAALGYFVKAFFAEGLEQMLWHITTMEALLGEKGEGVTNRLARRIASILGKTNKEKAALRKKFRELYSFRSDLVHGNQFKKQTYSGHLREARDLTRKSLLWFLNYLSTIQKNFLSDQSTESIPAREDILMLLDMDQKSRKRLGKLLSNLPSAFPYNKEWIE
jgi:hypothetical protein